MTAMNWLSVAVQPVSERLPPCWMASPFLSFPAYILCCTHTFKITSNIFLYSSDFIHVLLVCVTVRRLTHVHSKHLKVWGGTYSYRRISKGNVMLDKHLTLMSALSLTPLLLLTFPLYGLPSISFSSLEMKRRFVAHIGHRRWGE